MISEPLRNPLSLFDVKDKVAIITGASGTLGRATALALTALGGKVLLASGTQSELDEVASEVRELGGEPVPFGIVPDNRDALRTTAMTALAQCDVVLLSGGTSKGEGDLSYRVVGELG